MINIAICDDDAATTSLIEKYITQYTNKQNISCSCDVFFDGTTLLKRVCEEKSVNTDLL